MAPKSITEVLSKAPQDLLTPGEDVKNNALTAIKQVLDPIAKDYSIFDEIHTEGLDVDQVWAQVQMVVDGAVGKLMDKDIQGYEQETESESEESEGFEDELSQELSQEEEDEEDSEEGNSEEEGNEELDEDDENNEMDLDVEMDELDSANQSESESESESESKPEKSSSLDDGFFKLEDYQKQILALEKEDDDDEFIDYGASYVDGEGENEEEDDAEAKFEDFFAPPKKQPTNKKQKQNVSFKEPNDLEELEDDEEDEEKYTENVMESVKKDLFASDSEDSEDDYEQGDDRRERENLSTFEKQQREIMKQIQQLEQENVGGKKWQVRGEVKARERPLDSMLETEVDFERNVKAAPVITQETTDSLEDMIKERIKAENFDDLPRRIMDLLPEFKPSKSVEVLETKSSKSLAEIYEEDYAKSNTQDYVDADTEKLNAAHKEVEQLFSEVSRKLDALSSWNYTPKAAKPSISIVTNAAAISMEEAQPTTMATDSMLAPQEIYKASSADNKREVIGKDGVPVAKREMDKDERKRVRRRQKAQRAKELKQKDAERAAKAAQKSGSRADILQTLKRGNVTVIGKDGQKRDIDGKIRKVAKAQTSTNLKL